MKITKMNTLNLLLESIPELKELDEVAKINYRNEIGSLMVKHSNLTQLEYKYKGLLQEIDKLREDVIELKNRLFPTIYLGTAKHHTSKEPYLVGRTAWRKGKNDFIHLRVHIGAVSKFKEGINDPEVKLIALQKMREKIQSILPKVE
jgi:hypothetical protein